jgi:hypothetical protein
MQEARGPFEWCQLALLVLLPALLYALYAGQRARAAVGAVLHARSAGSRAPRVALLALTGLLGAALSAWAERQPGAEALWPALVPAFETLGLAAVVAWTAPGGRELAVGEQGLRSGWNAWRFDAMERARLEGHVLRFGHAGRTERVTLDARSLELVRARLGGEPA